MRTILLAAGIAIPLIYFANLFGFGALATGFDPGAESPSELGRDGAPNAALFNAGLFTVGVCALLASAGLWLGLRATGANVVVVFLTALSVACLGLAMLMAGIFPLPDPLHYGFNIIAGMLLTGLFGALALKGGARWVLLAGFFAGLGALALNAGVGGVANEHNIGWLIRAQALIAFSTIAFLCWAVMRRAN